MHGKSGNVTANSDLHRDVGAKLNCLGDLPEEGYASAGGPPLPGQQYPPRHTNPSQFPQSQRYAPEGMGGFAGGAGHNDAGATTRPRPQSSF